MVMDLESGKELWTKRDFGFASLIAIGKTLLILTEQGELVTAKANSESYQEISRIPLLEGICWTDPVYSYGRIYIRNERGKVICLERS